MKSQPTKPAAAQCLFTAPRQADGTILPTDIALEYLTTIALNFPQVDQVKSVRVEVASTSPAAIRIVRAISIKRLASRITTGKHKGKLREARAFAREMIADVLANKKDWKPYAGIFAAFAWKNDRTFFELMGRAEEKGGGRHQLFARAEWFLLLNWDQWTDPRFAKCPPLKFWKPETVLELLSSMGHEDQNKEISGHRSTCKRLGLEPVLPAKVIGILPVDGKPDSYRIVPAD